MYNLYVQCNLKLAYISFLQKFSVIIYLSLYSKKVKRCLLPQCTGGVFFCSEWADGNSRSAAVLNVITWH